MNNLLSPLLTGLARTTAWTLLAAVGTLLVLRIFRVRSSGGERLAWALVLCQGWLVWQFPVDLPPQLALPWTHRTDTPHHAEMAFPGGVGRLEDDQTVWAIMRPADEVSGQTLSVSSGRESRRADIGSPVSHWGLWLVAVWLGGGIVAVSVPILGYVRFLRRTGQFEPAPREWAVQWGQLLRDAGVCASIPLWTSRSCGPLLCRLPRGFVVIVPRDTWAALTARQRQGVLLHELAHYERGDVWKSVAARLLAWPQWFNPSIWYALRQFDECAERACDGRVHQYLPDGVTDYARALLAMAHSTGRPALASAAGGRELAARVRRLLSTSERKEPRMKAICVCAALTVVAGLGSIRPGPAAADNDSSPGAAELQAASTAAADGDQPADLDDQTRDPSPRHSGSLPANDEAYVDVKRLFDEEPGFKSGREELKRSLADAEMEMKRAMDELRSLSSRMREAEEQSSPEERDRLQRAAQDATAGMEAKRQMLRNSALERETELYRETYERVRSAVADYARENGIRIVRRKQAAVPERLDAAPNPQEMIRLMNQDVIFNADEPRDITGPVLQLLKVRAAEAK